MKRRTLYIVKKSDGSFEQTRDGVKNFPRLYSSKFDAEILAEEGDTAVKVIVTIEEVI